MKWNFTKCINRKECNLPYLTLATHITKCIGSLVYMCLQNTKQGQWPSRSPDLNTCDFYSYGKLKDEMYKNNPLTEDDVNGSIQVVVLSVSREF